MRQLPQWKWISLVICMLGIFVLFRWEMRGEPLNSDDLTLFQLSARAAAGQHWLFQGPWSNPPILWQPRKLEDLVELLKRKVPPFVLRDEQKEEWRGSLRGPQYREAIRAFQRVLWEQYTPLNAHGRWRLYQASAQPTPTELLPNGDFHDVNRVARTIPFWQLSAPIEELTYSP